MLRTIWSTLLTLTLTTTLCHAQVTNNLTLTFSPSDGNNNGDDSTCAGPDADNSITFSTYFLPLEGMGACLTLADIFSPNSTQNVRNTSYSFQPPNNGSEQYPPFERVYIEYSLAGEENWDPAKNWSNVLYTQLSSPLNGDPEIANDDQEYFGQRNIWFYHGDDCRQGSPGEELKSSYESNCRASEDCQQLPINVRSFWIYYPMEDDSDGGKSRDKEGKCVMAAEYGAAGVVRPAMVAVAAMLVLVVGVVQF